MKGFISKKEAERLVNMKGEVRGLGIKDDFLFVKKKRGEEEMRRAEKAVQDLGYEFDVGSIKTMGFYPMGYEALGLLAIHKVLGFGDNEIRQIGAYEAKDSLIIRIFTKYFVSIEKVAEKAPNMWSKYYTEGEISVPELDVEAKKGTVLLKNFKLHPLHCRVLEGYFSSVMEMVVEEKVVCREVRCPFKGDKIHEFSLRW